jgi:hypothetical protein
MFDDRTHRNGRFNVLVRHDYRALIGLAIGGAMIFYLVQY